MTEFQEIVPSDSLVGLAALAREIWTEYYTPLLGNAQVAYMLEHFQSETPMKEQMLQEGYHYFFLKQKEENMGYLGIQIKDQALFLSKLYVRKDARGMGIARDVMAFIEGWARGLQLSRIWLTVNRGNTDSVAAYQRLGFIQCGTQDADIGGGYVMDDYLFEKKL